MSYAKSASPCRTEENCISVEIRSERSTLLATACWSASIWASERPAFTSCTRSASGSLLMAERNLLIASLSPILALIPTAAVASIEISDPARL